MAKEEQTQSFINFLKVFHEKPQPKVNRSAAPTGIKIQKKNKIITQFRLNQIYDNKQHMTEYDWRTLQSEHIPKKSYVKLFTFAPNEHEIFLLIGVQSK